MDLRCHACGHSTSVVEGTLAARCERCGVEITLTSLETRARPSLARQGPAPEALLGQELGGYLLTSVIGGGGMGVVYEAKRTERATFAGPDIAAIKVLAPAFTEDPDFVTRFRRESDALTRLKHPNLIEVFGKGDYFFVMERFHGQDLRAALARGSMSMNAAAAIVRGAAAGLAFAHRNGIVHRDVKPANILVSGDPANGGAVKIVDFGVAQLATGQYTLTSLTHSELVLGTINYMSPEQRIDASGIDHRADIYALGVVAYELLTGRLPIGVFEPPSELATRVPRAADRVVLDALRRDPNGRPPSAEEFARRLERALLPSRAKKRWLLAGSSATALGLIGYVATHQPELPTKTQAQKQNAKSETKEPDAKAPAFEPSPALIESAAKMRTATELALKAALAEEETKKITAKKESKKAPKVLSKEGLKPMPFEKSKK